MAPIENDIVGIKFDNQQFEQAVSTTIASLERLTNALDLKAAAAGISNVTGAAQKVDVTAMSAGIDSVNMAFMAFRASYETIFRNLTTSAMQVGQKITNAFIIQPPSQGFSEYEMKMGAIQTMMAGTGEDLETVNKQLEELNAYSDQTIYSFGDMTQNIGKFTNAGVSLKDSVGAIKGVANVAALSGANAEEASRAMYNFGQALSSGYVKLVDWKSIELANMGTKEFKTQLLDAAVAAGTAKKAGNGYYKILTKNMQGKTIEKTISATKGFNDSLQYQWMTSKVLQSTLGDYADSTTAIGKRATKAATEVKTFTQMMGTITEAVGSDWSATFEQIFGDKDQATKLWTSIANAVGGITSTVGKARTEMFKFWNENGGRADIIAGLSRIFIVLGDVLKPIGQAFKDVFPPITGKTLVDLSKKFKIFTQHLVVWPPQMRLIRDVFTGIFSAISLGGKVIGFVFKVIGSFVEAIEYALLKLGFFKQSFSDGVGGIFKFVTNLNKTAESTNFFGKALETFRTTMVNVARNGGEALVKFFEYISNLATSVGQALAPIGNAIKNTFAGVSFDNVIVSIRTLIAGFAVFSGSSFLKGFLGLGDRLTSTFENFGGIKDVISGFTDVLKGMQQKLQAEALKQIAIAILLLAGAMFIMSLIKPERLKSALTATAVLMTGVLAMMTQFDKVTGGSNKDVMSAAVALGLLATALIILSVAVNLLGQMKPEVLMQGLTAIAALLGSIGIFSRLVSVDKGMAAAGLGMMLFATSLLILSKVIGVLGKMKPDELKQALKTLGVIFLGIAGFSRIIDPGSMAVAGLAMIGISIGIGILAGALKLLSGISLEGMAIALGGLGIALGILAAFLKVTADPMVLVGAAALLIVSVSLIMLSGALKVLSSINVESMIVALLGLGAALGMIAIFLMVASNPMMLVGAATLLIVSGALVLLSIALKAIGSIPTDDLIKALLGIGIAFAMFVAVGYAIVGALPGLFGLGAAMLMIGVALVLAGAGVLMFAGAFAILASVLATSGAVIAAFLITIGKSLPVLAYALATSIGSFLQGMMDQAGTILAAVTTLVGVVLDALIKVLPKLLTFFNLLIQGIVNLLVTNIPIIVNALLSLLNSLLVAIGNWLPSIMTAATDIVVAFIDGMANHYTRIADAGANFIIKVIEGIGDSMLKIANAAMKTVIEFIEGLTTAINKNGKRFDKAVKKLISAVFDRAKALLGIDGEFSFGKIGDFLISGLTTGIKDKIDDVVAAVGGVIGAAYQAAKDAGWIKSPSKLFAKIGVWLSQGLAGGIVATTGTVQSVAKNTIAAAYSAMQSANAAANDIIVGIQDPVIKPIMDLDGVRKGVGAISSLMAGTPALQMAGAVGARSSQSGAVAGAAGTNGGGNTNIDFTQNIYSPKAPDRLTIYRGTSNGLRQLKRVGAIS